MTELENRLMNEIDELHKREKILHNHLTEQKLALENKLKLSQDKYLESLQNIERNLPHFSQTENQDLEHLRLQLQKLQTQQKTILQENKILDKKLNELMELLKD